MARKLRFSDAAFAMECTQKALRKMLQNPSLVLPAPPRDGWTEFSQVQLAVLTISRRLVEFGYSVSSATSTGCMVVFEALSDEGALQSRPLNAREFLGLLSDLYLTIHYEEGEPRPEIRHLPAWPKLSKAEQARATLILPVGAIVARAFERATVSNDDDMTGIDEELLRALFKLPIQFVTERNATTSHPLKEPHAADRPIGKPPRKNLRSSGAARARAQR